MFKLWKIIPCKSSKLCSREKLQRLKNKHVPKTKSKNNNKKKDRQNVIKKKETRNNQEKPTCFFCDDGDKY